MKKNHNIFNQIELNNDISIVRNQSGILRDTSNDYNRATGPTASTQQPHSPANNNTQRTVLSQPFNAVGNNIRSNKSDTISQLEKSLIEQSNEITRQMIVPKDQIIEELDSNVHEAECQVLRSSQEDILSRKDKVMASIGSFESLLHSQAS